ncbi:protein tumorous imaginal discs, mitochondrial-like [Oppia nitens]|uniref:protein tumorous imaginal discs, mitochondrial-like n=1 Tax=Oppia nitens TaxID=1686743 RepID=UPI0023D996DD|nr:protein tumorous imaginal discs, mitochondrial-like [Oppia nitens]
MTTMTTIALINGHCLRHLRQISRLNFRSHSWPRLATTLCTRNGPLIAATAGCRHFQTGHPLNASKDYYETLGVDRSSSQKDIKKAYYQLAKKYHPDTNKNDPSASKRFQDVSEAYEVLGDEGKRRQYDQYGSAASSMGGGAGSQGFSGFQGFHSNIDPEELFRNIFGDFSKGFGGQSTNEGFDFDYGAPQEIQMSLSFKEAAKGCTKEINISVVDTCPKCNGSRCAEDHKPVKCPYCQGTGMETISTGPFVMRSTCRMCKGTRLYIKHPCRDCGGKGTTQQRKKIQIPVPAGVDDGSVKRMQIGNKELFITFRVSRSDYFRRDGADIHTDTEISLAQAILGGTVNVGGLYEDVTLKIPSGTSSHSRIRLSGKGIRRVDSYGYGDHYIHLKIRVPQKLSPKQKALALVLAELDETNLTSKGTTNGIIETRSGRVAEGDAEHEELVNNIRNALEETDGEESDRDRAADKKD